MIVALALFTFAFGALVGGFLGHHGASTRTKEALKLARYNDAIALADDLVKTPDSLDLRPRAQKILAAHRAASSGDH